MFTAGLFIISKSLETVHERGLVKEGASPNKCDGKTEDANLYLLIWRYVNNFQ